MMFYALNVALILAGCFLFYKVLLQKETFFPLNRFVLLGCLALSFGLPLIQVPQQWSFRNVNNNEITGFIDLQTNRSTGPATVSSPNIKESAPSAQTLPVQKESFFKDISVKSVVIWAYWLGVAIFGLNFLFQLCLLLFRSFKSPFIQDGRYRIVELSGNHAPCSFGNYIFINPEKYDWDTYSQIILHEKIHIQQGHSYDIIFAELALIFQWFNPFAWFYRKAMEDNLEFLTDSELLEHTEVELASYQMSLVKVSAPHFPISLTTNYNQSILKKRLIMMNSKKSSLNSTWKYLCIVPLLLVLVSLLNEPVVYGKNTTKTTTKINKSADVPNKGTWFATIKGDKIKIRFEGDENSNNNSNTDFNLSDFKDLPRTATGNFSLTRDAGTIVFTGKFEGNAGMGNYQFNADENYINYLEKEGIKVNKEKDVLIYYLVNVKKDFVKMLKDQGFTSLSKNDLIPLAALNVTADYITGLKNAGLTGLTLTDLIPLKALNIDAAFVADIKKSGYKDLTASKLIPLKAQGIDGDAIKNAKMTRNASEGNTKPSPRANPKPSQKNDDEDDIMGQLIAKKVMNITPEFIKSFTDAGLKFDDEEYVAIKALGITPAYCKSFHAIGLTNLDAENFISLKALNITAEEFNAYNKLGFKKLETEDVVSAKATGTTAAFITAMRKKGHNYSNIEKYIQMKVLAIGGD
jgi:hypothetical protein